ncbi:hypothetical protein CAPTEDRAFT_104115 [Capitella teleta]|uniref:Exostosin GT47 domain-containing protein n=1 Tax=Capitella teleta TaxID=283909 RepID=R7VBF1_CAPTE|nr:hypothetical protein CAPTEDRAFT_104115 [Capitella teleta]|eukprot:ELU15959.1 hypothetical protein CAPTEDRAFT_104115 [Capitella teleta]
MKGKREGVASLPDDGIINVEVWGKAAIGLYLWQHILEGSLEERLGGVWNFGELQHRDLKLRFRTGPGVVPAKVPHDVQHLVLVLNGREPAKIDFAVSWLEFISELKHLRHVVLVLLGSERCENQWAWRYLRGDGGPVDMVYLVYDSVSVDGNMIHQWPLGVATYRSFPLVEPSEVDAEKPRKYRCSFVGTVYANSSRSNMMQVLTDPLIQQQCYVRPRYKWQPNENPKSLSMYIHSLQNSDLVLNPIGMNSECYRIYEALSYGSVPVIEDIMTPGQCGTGESDPSVAAPLRLLKELGAPFIYVNDWSELPSILQQEAMKTQAEVVMRRKKVLLWYRKFKRTVKFKFLDRLHDLFAT